jgi:UDP-N-acetylglucosamine 2-epimerase (non-hydrolysing)
MKTIVTITGIRPDFIRMSKIFNKLDEADWCNHILIHTGQHYDELLSGELGTKTIQLFEKESIKPDLILFLGDSNSVLASVPLRKEGYKIGHIEAGMRSYDERMLEEINRKVCDHVSNFLFVYHENYKQKAMREGIAEEKIHVVGNTIVEPLRDIIDTDYRGTKEHILMDIHRPEKQRSTSSWTFTDQRILDIQIE